jgi:hypothetical protein
MFIACACSATFDPDNMKKSSVPQHLPVALPPLLVADRVEATNNSHLGRLMATFAGTLSSMISYGTTGESLPSEMEAKRDMIGDELTIA